MGTITYAESASLWAIRLAMLVMVGVYAAELAGTKRCHRCLAFLWLVGALLALGHSLGSLITFHHGNQAEALESTAQQTQALLGFRFGAGLYVNYVFVVVWLLDATLRLGVRNKYERFPNAYFYCVHGFLIFIAINGAIVFKAGLVRVIGILSVLLLSVMAWRRRYRNA